jgi:hypothetical protein
MPAYLHIHPIIDSREFVRSSHIKRYPQANTTCHAANPSSFLVLVLVLPPSLHLHTSKAFVLTFDPKSSSPTMAPPPPSNLPLQERVLQLVQTLQFAWFAGHVTLLLSSIRYSISYLTFHAGSKWALFSYRTAFVAAAATYGIVVFKSFRARARAGKAQGGLLQIVGDENVQYLGVSLHGSLTSEFKAD